MAHESDGLGLPDDYMNMLVGTNILSASKIKALWDHYMGKGENVSLTESTASEQPFFPFQLDDLQYWVVKRKDGMVVKYRVVGPQDADKSIGYHPEKQTTLPISTAPYQHLSAWCKHELTDLPVWQTNKFDLYICDASGCRMGKEEVETIMDCGDILPIAYVRGTNQSVLDGDEDLTKSLQKYGILNTTQPRVLKIDWDDRAAPPLEYPFWEALAKKLSGTVMTACQGGHGRSGTSLVCLMMATNPEYTPADAIIHLRAVHCPRAIESVVQHSYIGEYGKFLGRVNDIDRVKNIKDFKEAFLKLTMKSAKPYQDRLKNPPTKK